MLSFSWSPATDPNIASAGNHSRRRGATILGFGPSSRHCIRGAVSIAVRITKCLHPECIQSRALKLGGVVHTWCTERALTELYCTNDDLAGTTF